MEKPVLTYSEERRLRIQALFKRKHEIQYSVRYMDHDSFTEQDPIVEEYRSIVMELQELL